ncbi:AraC family transcriptional regulator [Paraburkholderia unamae]|uniref:AraC-like DNA-binding protein n=1 Tax=Paraburkholderia unamae TaxID=219649 RepID=A0ABX5KC02_9BURK|nr:AraC family transcriptional regulator [Paraburkholderia unamae]PVX61100.1 AraC-like DNA-binding protein [Paraburkholderia unamae]RAR51713.1 AraC-like DNA-binding protein [Paraburkholderia unamae]CAG9273311.1 AraC family transcriptional regulator [Paraburkholderia unamae]
MKRVPVNSGFPMIRGAVMGPIMRALDAADADCDALLAEFGLSRRQLSNPYEIVALGRYVGAFERAANVLDEPYLGLRLGSELQLTELGPAGLVFMSSPTLGSAIRKFTDALGSWQSGTAVDLVRDNEWPMWSYRIAHTHIWPRRQDAEYSVSAMCHMIRLVRGAAWAPVEVHFEHAAPADLKPYMRVFRVPVRFQQPASGVVLHPLDLDAPLKSADVQMARMMERHATDLISRDTLPHSLVDQVRDLVTRRLAREKLVVADIARDLGLSDRSLQRHLGEAGTSVRQIIREERERSVAVLREQDGMTNAAVARAVGYADATVLWRATRNWGRTGVKRTR